MEHSPGILRNIYWVFTCDDDDDDDDDDNITTTWHKLIVALQL